MQIGSPPIRRKPSLTPMIDVVFLLLVFFMLAARFGQDVVIDLPISAASDKPYEGPPRLIDVLPGAVRLNGVEMPMAALLPEHIRTKASIQPSPIPPTLRRRGRPPKNGGIDLPHG